MLEIFWIMFSKSHLSLDPTVEISSPIGYVHMHFNRTARKFGEVLGKFQFDHVPCLYLLVLFCMKT